MMGGSDYEIIKVIYPNDIEVLVRFFKAIWKSAVVSDSKGNRTPITKAKYSDLFMGKQFVIYKDQNFVDKWDKEGFSEDVSDTAIFVTIDDHALYLTYDYDINLIEQVKKNIFQNSTLWTKDIAA